MSIDGRDAARFAGDLRQDAAAVAERMPALVRHYGLLLWTQVVANASGRPGPNAPTGDYRRSMHMESTEIDGAPAAIVGTNHPQARRLEYGFSEVDSLGRHYHQPPFAHFGPALWDVGARFKEAVQHLARGTEPDRGGFA